jgi:outer membrane lipoprotein-sorting protein
MRLSRRGFGAASACWVAASWFAPGRAGGTAAVAAAVPDEMTAGQILKRMGDAYAGCKSYRDSGVSKSVFNLPDQTFSQEKPFQTAFARPDRFRFEYRETRRGGPEDRYIIWRRGDEVRTWWDVTPGVKEAKSLAFALGAAAGVSSLTSHMIPSLLLPEELAGRNLSALAGAKRIEDGRIEEVDCYRIEGKYGSLSLTLWIDKERFLVRRIDSTQQIKADGRSFRVDETKTYDPVMDGEVPEAALAFDPPAL